MFNLKKKPQRRSRDGKRKPRPLTPRQQRERAEKRANILKVAGLVSVFTGGITLAYPHLQSALNENTPNTLTACFEGLPDQKHTAIFISYSTTNLFASSSNMRDLGTEFVQLFERMPVNGKLSVFTTSPDTTGDVVDPIYEVCRLPKNRDERRALVAQDPNIAPMNPKQIKTIYDTTLETVKTQISELIEDSRSAAAAQRWNQPLLEQFKSISRYYRDTQIHRFVAFTDGISFSERTQFCATPNHLPSFANYKRRDLYNDMKPHSSFSGAEVTFLMPQVIEQRMVPYQHCSQNELNQWWESYWLDAGVQESDIEIQPLIYRPDVALGSVGIFLPTLLVAKRWLV